MSKKTEKICEKIVREIMEEEHQVRRALFNIIEKLTVIQQEVVELHKFFERMYVHADWYQFFSEIKEKSEDEGEE